MLNSEYIFLNMSCLHSRYQEYCFALVGLHPRASMNSRLGLYNGEKIVLTTSDYNLVSAARFFWRYGRDIFKLQTYIDDLLDNFSK